MRLSKWYFKKDVYEKLFFLLVHIHYSFALLVAPLPLSAITQDSINAHDVYLYLGQDQVILVE